MSFSAVSQVITSGLKNSTDVAVLIALAHCLNEQSGKCCPSVSTLARLARRSENVVRKAIKSLASQGFIGCSQDPGGVRYFTLFLFRLPLPEVTPLADPTPPSEVTPPCSSVTTPLAKVKGDPLQICKPNKEVNREVNKEVKALPPSPPPARRKTAFPCPPEINPEAWDAWMQIRKAKRTGGITEYGWKLFCNQAAKAGLTPAQAIDLCIERGWQGFKAEWLKREQEPEDDFKRMGRQERERQRLAKQQGQAPAPSSKPASEPQNHDDEIYEELNGLF